MTSPELSIIPIPNDENKDSENSVPNPDQLKKMNKILFLMKILQFL